MSYVIDDLSRVWLVIDEMGLIISICATQRMAQDVAAIYGARVEMARSGDWKVGDTLSVFHV